MLIPKFLFSPMQQLLEQRMPQVRDRNHKPPLCFSHVNRKVAFWDIIRRRNAPFSRRKRSSKLLLGFGNPNQLNTHCIVETTNLISRTIQALKSRTCFHNELESNPGDISCGVVYDCGFVNPRIPSLLCYSIRVPSVTHSSRILRKFSSRDIPKGHIAVYVGQDDQKKRYVSHPWFQDLLSQAQEEFGFNHSMGGLTIPCAEDALCSSHFSLR
nr:auxin-responsive protein SAUR21-like [Ipomoea batatas]